MSTNNRPTCNTNKQIDNDFFKHERITKKLLWKDLKLAGVKDKLKNI